MTSLWTPGGPQYTRPGGIFWRARRLLGFVIALRLHQLSAAITGGAMDNTVVAASLAKTMTALSAGMLPKSVVADLLPPRLLTALTGSQADPGVIADTVLLLVSAAQGGQLDSGTIADVLATLTTAAQGAQVGAGSIIGALSRTSTTVQGGQQIPGLMADTMLTPLTATQTAQVMAGTITDPLPANPASALLATETTALAIADVLLTASATMGAAQLPSAAVTASLTNLTTAVSAAQAQIGAIADFQQALTTAMSGLSVSDSESAFIATAIPALLTTDTESAQTQSSIIISSLPAGPSAQAAAIQTQAGALADLLPALSSQAAVSQPLMGGMGSVLGSLLSALTGPTHPIRVGLGTPAFNGNTSSGTSGTDACSITTTDIADVILAFVHTGTGSVPTATCKVGTTPMVSLGKVNYSTSGGYWQGEVFALQATQPAGGYTVNHSMSWSTSHGWYVTVEAVAYRNVEYVGLLQSISGSSQTPSHTLSSYVGELISQAFFATVNFDSYNQDELENLPTVTNSKIGLDLGDAIGTGSTLAFSAHLASSAAWTSLAVPLLVAAPPPAQFDSVGAGNTGHTSSAITWAHTIGALAKLLLGIYSIIYSSTTTALAFKIGSTTFGAGTTGLVPGGSVQFKSNTGTPSTTENLFGYELFNPATGAQTMSLQANGSAYLAANTVAYTNAAVIKTPVVATGTSASASVTVPTTPGQLVVFYFTYSVSTTAFSSVTTTDPNGVHVRWNQPGVGSTCDSLMICDVLASGSSVTVTAVIPASEAWAAIGAQIALV